MNIQKTNNSPAFGMAFRLTNYQAAKGLAEKFHKFSDPLIAEEHFTKEIVKPLESLKSDVLYDGKDVFVIDGFTKDKYKLLDSCGLNIKQGENLGISYPVEQNGKLTEFNLFSSKPDNEIVTDKFKIGVKIAQYIENLRKSTTEAVDETAGRLFSLYK